MDCVFCDIVKGKTGSSLEVKKRNVTAFRSIDPAAEIHILIVPNVHTESFMDLNKKLHFVFLEMIEVARFFIKKYKIENGYKLVINGGKYQSIKHLHLHLLGGKMKADYIDRI